MWKIRDCMWFGLSVYMYLFTCLYIYLFVCLSKTIRLTVSSLDVDIKFTPR